MPKSVRISIDPDLQMQTIIGFGGAFTDSAGLNIASVERDLQEQIMLSYFGPNGVHLFCSNIFWQSFYGELCNTKKFCTGDVIF